MAKKLILLVLLIILFALPSYAGQPEGYDQPDKFLTGYFSALPKQEQTERALAIVKAMYPKWEESYRYGVFDCSEMTAYLQYFFKLCDIESNYCQSDQFWHCWLEVPNGEDKLLIEPTTLRIVPKDQWEWRYYRYHDVTYNRYMEPTEVDWWTHL